MGDRKHKLLVDVNKDNPILQPVDPKMQKLEEIIPIAKWLSREYPKESGSIGRLVTRYCGNTGLITTSKNSKYVTHVFGDISGLLDVVCNFGNEQFANLKLGDMVEFSQFIFVDQSPEAPNFKQRVFPNNETYIQFEKFEQIKGDDPISSQIKSFDKFDSFDIVKHKDDDLIGLNVHVRAITPLQAPQNKMSSDGKRMVPYHMSVKDMLGDGKVASLSVWPGSHTDKDYFNATAGDEFHIYNVSMKLYGNTLQLQSHPTSVFNLDITKNLLGFDEKTVFGVVITLLQNYGHGKCNDCEHALILNNMMELTCDVHGVMTEEVKMKDILQLNLRSEEKKLKTTVLVTKSKMEEWGMPKDIRTNKGLNKYFEDNIFTVDIVKKELAKIYVRAHF